jgi:hypothetical protein
MLTLTFFLLVATSQAWQSSWSYRPQGASLAGRNIISNNNYYNAPLSTSTTLLASSSAIDEEEILESQGQSSLTLKIRCAEIFETLETSSDKDNVNHLNIDVITSWEDALAALTADLRLVRDRRVLLEVYSAILSMAAPNMLDPLQMSTFELVSQYF